MAKQQKAYRQFLRKFKIPFLAGDTTVKFLFLLLSVFLWFLIKLSSEGYVTELNFPVKYVNIPGDKRLENKPEKAIKVKVRSLGYDILKYKLRSLSPVELNVSNAVQNKNGRYFWATNSKRDFIAGEFDENTEVVSISPDTVFFDFSVIQSKKVRVFLRVHKMHSNFVTFYRAPQVTPDSITVSGSSEEIKKLDSIFTKTIDLTAEQDSVTINAPLDLPKNTPLKFSANSVKVKLRYTNLTEGSFDVPVNVVNLPEEYELNVFPEKVNLRFQVPVEDFDQVNPEDFQLYVDYNEVRESEGQRFMTVHLQSMPAYLKKVTFDPKQLEYILIQK